MTIDEMKSRKQELGYSYARLSELSGVPVPTIQKIFSGTTASPRYETLKALEKVLQLSKSPDTRSMIKESAVSYAAETTGRMQGSYTIEDYYQLPEDHRAELINGVIYDMDAPAPVHQLICGEVYAQIRQFIREHHGSCIPFISPIDVQLNRDDRTMVQPDVIIVSNEDIISNRNIYGAPDFVLEVVSPSTRRKDFTKKLTIYEAAGVREYWLIDPYKRMVFVYFFEDEALCPGLYPIDGEIPLNLYQGKLNISLDAVLKWLPPEQQ